MSDPTDPHAPRALFSEDGKTWTFAEGSGPVTKIVVGTPPKPGDDAKPVRPAGAVQATLAALPPTVTHLHLWQITALKTLPPGVEKLPLQCLDLRGCTELETLPELPASLETLDLGGCAALKRLPSAPPQLERLYLNGCDCIEPTALRTFLNAAADCPLRELEASSCDRLDGIDRWAETLEGIELNHCLGLVKLPNAWPGKLRRLGLFGAFRLRELPDFPRTLDYLDLQGMKQLRKLPRLGGQPRTLFIHGSGLELPNELFGQAEGANVAPAVLAHLGERQHVLDREVKVIVLGDGRAGKSSLSRRLAEGRFDPREKTTHGIHLWTLELPFEPVDERGKKAKAKLNLWDFAGQDLYHQTHRLFMQSKAIFLLCGNSCPDGADPATDGTDDDHLPEGEDIRRNLRYWREQVEALGAAPGMDGPPPMLVVRTKVDRDDEDPAYARNFRRKSREAALGLKKLDVSAKTGKGIAKLKDWLSEQAARVLGPRGKREIGANPMKAKRELALKMAENDAAHRENERRENERRENERRENERSGPRVPSPHPVMTRETRDGVEGFDTLVRRHCPTGAYHRSPELLLEWLHLSGFLFHNPRFLPNTVVLDQRWAIAGMYAAFERKVAWPNLLAARGRFTPGELAEWSWRRAGFSAEHQALFLNYMQSCGMAFRLGTLDGGEEEYLAPSALPLGGPRCEREAADHRAGIEAQEAIVLEHHTLSREAVMQLLVELGREWRRAPVLWRWGGQFQSYRNREWHWDRPLTFVHLDWQETSPESFGGRLTLTPYGPDRSFLAAILNECRKLGGFSQVAVPEISLREEAPELGELHVPAAAPRDSTEAHQPGMAHADAVEIGISFAGDQSTPVESWEALPDTSIEKWPLALAAALRAMQFKVEEYRAEQSQMEHGKEQGRKPYLDKLASRDYVIPFLSWPYLESPWCMYEFLRIYNRMENGVQNPETVRVASFRDALFSQTNLAQRRAGTEQSPRSSLAKFWQDWLGRFNRRVAADAETMSRSPHDVHAHGEELQSYAYSDWAACVRDAARFKAILDVISGGWTVLAIDHKPDPKVIAKWVGEIAENTRRYDVLMKYALAAEKSGDRDRAQRLFIHAFLGGDPDGQPEGLEAALEKKMGRAELDDIRRSVLEEFRAALQRGKQIANWKELAAVVAPTQAGR